MPTRNVNLTKHYDQFVSKQIASGRYQNASEVMRAGLRLLERQKRAEAEKLKLLRKLAAEGFKALDQGSAVTLDESALGEYVAKIGRRVSRRSGGHRNGR